MEVAINHLTQLLNDKFTESKLLKERKPLAIYSIQKVADNVRPVQPRVKQIKRSELAIRFVEPTE